jgi:hypothetical protein
MTDNDRDGLVDYPFDPGCLAAGDPDERDPDPRAACSNGIDDDGDGRVDFPRDPGCVAPATTAKPTPPLPRLRQRPRRRRQRPPRLARRPRLPLRRRRQREVSDGAPAPRCADGLDNDDDGIIDLADVGCQDAATTTKSTHRATEVLQWHRRRRRRPHRLARRRWLRRRRRRLRTARLRPLRWHLPAIARQPPPLRPLRTRVQRWHRMHRRPLRRRQVFRNTGDQGNQLTAHNGVEWYFSESYSIGFVAPGTGVSRNSCDTAGVQPQFRLCWHTGGRRFNGGYRCGAQSGLNGSRDWERVIWTSR